MEGCLGIVDLENEMVKPSVPGLVSDAMPWLRSLAHSVLREEFVIEVQNLVWLFHFLNFLVLKMKHDLRIFLLKLLVFDKPSVYQLLCGLLKVFRLISPDM